MGVGAFGAIRSGARGAAAWRWNRAAGAVGSGVVGKPFGAVWDPTGHAYRAKIATGRQPLFVDSSGNPRSRSGDDAYYTLVGLTGGPRALGALSTALYGLKVGLVPGMDPLSWELHGVRITHRRKYYPLRPRTEAGRLDVFGGFTRIMCESDVALFGVAIDNGRAYSEFGADVGITDRAWTLLLERYELFMRYQGGGFLGHVVSDKTGGADMQHIGTLVSDSGRGRNPVSGIRTPHVAGRVCGLFGQPPGAGGRHRGIHHQPPPQRRRQVWGNGHAPTGKDVDQRRRQAARLEVALGIGRGDSPTRGRFAAAPRAATTCSLGGRGARVAY